MSYDGLVLDHDGVLMRMAASETITDAVVAAFAAAGVTDPRPADIDKLTVGVDPEDVRAVAERHGLDPATLWEYREAAVHEALQDATVAGAKGPYDDVGVLRDLDCPLGIASNNQSRTVSYMLDHHDLSDLFVAVHARESTFDSLHRKKPNPELLTAGSSVWTRPRRCTSATARPTSKPHDGPVSTWPFSGGRTTPTGPSP